MFKQLLFDVTEDGQLGPKHVVVFLKIGFNQNYCF